MKVRKYTARTSRDALRQVREDLGPDAVILSNRMVKGGVEVMALAASEMAVYAASRAPRLPDPASHPLEVTEQDVVGVVAREAAPAPAARLAARLTERLAERLAERAVERGTVPPAEPPVVQQAPVRVRQGLDDPARDALLEPVPAEAHERRDTAVFPKLDLAFDPERQPAMDSDGGFQPLVAREQRAAGLREPQAAAPRRDPVFAREAAPAVRREPVFQAETAVQAAAAIPVRPATLGLRPSPAPLAPPPAPVVARPSAPVAPAAPAAASTAPAVLRRRASRGAGPEHDGPAEVTAASATAATGDPAQLEALAARHDPLMAALAEEVRSLGSMLGQSATPAAAPAGLPSPGHAAMEAVEARTSSGGDAWMRNMMGELRSMRVLIEDQMGAMAFADAGRMAPGRSRVVRLLSAAGFSAALIRKVTARLPENVGEPEAVAFVREALRNNLTVAGSEAELLDQGGVFALVGPTGAGKTTTAAKLAARFVVRHGAENLALLTTDGYRIGGQEQLRIYGRILGVAVHAVKDPEDLRRTLGELRNRKLVLIDTVGLSQRDRLVAEQHALFAQCGTPVRRLLLLNATCHGETLADVVRAYRGDGLAGCIVTKLDEAAAPGAAIDVAIRERLRVFYAADGQRVPEDLHAADGARLVERALQVVQAEGPGAQAEADFPFVLPPAHVLAAMQGAPLGEVAHG